MNILGAHMRTCERIFYHAFIQFHHIAVLSFLLLVTLYYYFYYLIQADPGHSLKTHP